MQLVVYDAHSYDKTFLDAANQAGHTLVYTTAQLDEQTAVLAKGSQAICCFVNDSGSAAVLEQLAEYGIKLIVLRCTGYNNIDLAAAARLGITVMRVGSYSPYAVAEFAVGLLQTLNRRIHRAYNRTREHNFRLGGLLGQDIHGKTVGVIGTGKIGAVFSAIMKGFGCSVLAYDVVQNPECLQLGVRYVDLNTLMVESDIISLHVPLLPQTHYLINAEALARMKTGVMLINTSRGGLIDTNALIDALKEGRVGAVGLDVYEEEQGLFFRDLSDRIIEDDVFTRLMTFPNVLVTGHQAFFTQEALTTIAETTMRNIADFEAGIENQNTLKP